MYIPYTLNRQYSESTLNSYEMIRQFFDVTLIYLSFFMPILILKFIFLPGDQYKARLDRLLDHRLLKQAIGQNSSISILFARTN